MEELKDLGVLYKKIKAQINIWTYEEKELPSQFKSQITIIGDKNIDFYKFSAFASKNNGDSIIIPNQWFYLSKIMLPYNEELHNYYDKVSQMGVFSSKRLEELKGGSALTATEEAAINKVTTNAKDALRIKRFVTDYKWWHGAKSLGRVQKDYYVSAILSLSGLVNDSANFLATICEFLTLNPNLSELLVERDDDFSVNKQLIFYGAPGTGKSFKINECTQGDDTVIRTTFHPDSDYSTFVGCYKPIKEMTDTLSIHKLHELYPEFKNKVTNRPLHRFITKYHNSFRLLTEKEAESVFDKVETSATVSAEVPKIMSAIEELPPHTITYSFVKQAFTKAYIQAWEKMCNVSLPTTKSAVIIPISMPTSPYSTSGEKGSSSHFDHTPDGSLSSDEIDLLKQVDNFDFSFDRIQNFSELHDEIKVVVTDRPQDDDERYHKKITFTAVEINMLYSLWESDKDQYAFLMKQGGLLPSIYQKLREEEKIKKGDGIDILGVYDGEDVTIVVDERHSLLGQYDSSNKTVFLYKANIGNDLNLLAAVYIHEMFHAYFDLVGHQYIPEIEEPIVECCTLCFLELFNYDICEKYLNCVKRKQQSSAICYYGFGVHLYDNRSLDWMMLYKNGLNKINISPAKVNNYKNKFSLIYPFEEEQETMSLLYNILNPQSKTVFDKTAQFLIIEEINRGNCAQIFGDLFQLLDRKEGYSEYPIEPDEDLRKELESEFAGLKMDVSVENEINSIFKENYPNGITEKILKGELLVLPENLYIWATMNTSDQSLFPIDSAFKRRWEWKYIPIGYKNKDWKIKIGVKTYKWVDFQREINDKIYSIDYSEDKLLGDFFVDANRTGKIISADTLLNKILFYIWNDVCKDEPDQIFRWKDDRDGYKEKSIRFSDFFCEKSERNRKLQGLMSFLDVSADGESGKEEKSEISLSLEEPDPDDVSKASADE